MKSKGILIAIVVAAAILIYNAAYIVNETEQVVITQFGRIIGGPKKDPGLKFKIPFIQTANYFAKNLLDWDGDPGQIPTLDKTFIWVDTFARWKITDPVKFFQTVNNRFSAIGKLNDIIDPSVRNFITSNKLIEAVENGTVFKSSTKAYWKCRNCGRVHEGTEPPDICPSCLHPKAHFELLAENY